MNNRPSTNGHRSPDAGTNPPRPHDHVLVAVDQWLPGKVPTDYDIDLSDADGYRTRFWRCRRCGQERNRPTEFDEPCQGGPLLTPLEDGGYSIDDPRTRRALTEEMDVRFGDRGPTYEVHSQSGRTYRTDIDAETCTCLDYQRREVFCKHLRRVDLEILAGTVPAPDGTFKR